MKLLFYKHVFIRYDSNTHIHNPSISCLPGSLNECFVLYLTHLRTWVVALHSDSHAFRKISSPLFSSPSPLCELTLQTNFWNTSEKKLIEKRKMEELYTKKQRHPPVTSHEIYIIYIERYLIFSVKILCLWVFVCVCVNSTIHLKGRKERNILVI